MTKKNLSYHQADKLFRESSVNELAQTDAGLRFLLLRSMSRAELLKKLARDDGMAIDSVPAKDLLRELFESSVSTDTIKGFITSEYAKERILRKKNEASLINELYQVRDFDWGGLYQNNLEKSIVDNYVKKIDSYRMICQAIDKKLYPSLRSYTLCSWYNHWTSIVIEDIFRDHISIIPSIGKIKQIDFFQGDTPYDLKVTRFPEEYIALQRKRDRQQPELTVLKKVCKELAIPISKDLSGSRLLEDLWCKITDHPSDMAKTVVHDLKSFRDSILNAEKLNPISLIQWYYENQGERRFDASNRLFLILVDSNNYFNSWQLKRAKDLIQTEVHSSLDKMANKGGKKVSFKWNGKNYTVTSDVIFVVK